MYQCYIKEKRSCFVHLGSLIPFMKYSLIYAYKISVFFSFCLMAMSNLFIFTLSEETAGFESLYWKNVDENTLSDWFKLLL